MTLAAASASAQEPGAPVLHGFGSWAYGRTDGNAYLAGDHEGRYDDASFTINVSSSVTDRLRVVAQAEWQDGRKGTEIELSYAFAEWKVSDKLSFRAGKTKLPFGVSTEVFDVGTLRPFVELPQAVYGPSGIQGEAYKGLGLTGTFDLKHGWSLDYDVYGGGQDLTEYVAPESVTLGEPFTDGFEFERTRNLIGARLVVDPPVIGLRIGGSVHTGHEIGQSRRTGVGLQGEYRRDRWSARSEYAREAVRNDSTVTGFYGELAYRFGPHWQVAGQYDHLTTHLDAAPTPPVPSLLRHEEVAAGLNYWWHVNFVFKLSYHHVSGNRFAGPVAEDLLNAVTSGTLKEKTNLVLFGTQFTF